MEEPTTQPTQPTNSQPVNAPIEQKPSRFSKKFLIIGLSLALLVIIPFAWLIYETATAKYELYPPASLKPTQADWKTYNGNDFSFKYPADWKITTTNSIVNLIYQDQDPPEIEHYSIPFIVKNNPNNDTLESYLTGLYQTKTREELEKQYKITDITVDGTKGLQLASIGLPKYGPLKSVILSKDKKFIEIGYTAVGQESMLNKFENTFSQILTTFKFTQ